MKSGRIKDGYLLDKLIEERKRTGTDRYDEVWEGMYVMPSMPSMAHQELVHELDYLFGAVVSKKKKGKVFPGANLSDRRDHWEHNYRIPDLVVVTSGSKAVLYPNHIMGAADFLVEIESPGDDTEEKVPFYSQIGVRELLIIHRDRSTLRLLRNDGEDLIEAKPSSLEGKQWLVSEVLPLALRRKTTAGVAHTEVRRTDEESVRWIV